MPDIPTWAKPIKQVPSWAKPLDSGIPELRQAPELSLLDQTWEKAKGLFKDPVAEKARATQAMVDSQLFNIRPYEAYNYRDDLDRVSTSNKLAKQSREELGQMVRDFQESPEWSKLPGEIAGAASGVVSGTSSYLQAWGEMSKASAESYRSDYEKQLKIQLKNGAISQEIYDNALNIFDTQTEQAKTNKTNKWAKENVFNPTAEKFGKVLKSVEDTTGGYAQDKAPEYVGTFLENPSWRRAFSALAQGTGSLAIAIPASIVAGPEAGAIILSAAEAGPTYQEARAAGKSEKESMKYASMVLVGTAILEKVGLDNILKATGGKTARFFKGAIAEAGTEDLQTLWQNGVARHGYDETVGYFDHMIEATIGGFVGGPAAVAFGTKGEKPKPVKMVKTPDEIAKEEKVKEEQPEEVKEDPEIDEIVNAPEEYEDAVIDDIINRTLEMDGRRETFKQQAAQVVGDDQADAVTSLLDARSKAVGMSTDEYLEYHNIQLGQGGVSEGGKVFNQNISEDQAKVDDNFKNWSNGYEVLSNYEIYNATPGQGYVFKAYHGTTHDFDIFDPTRTGNKEGQFGAVNYFTSDEGDADMNYAGEGPDLTKRIDFLKEQLENLDADELADELGIDVELAEVALENEEALRQLAAEQLLGDNPQTLETYVRLDNPVFIGGPNETWIENQDLEQYREDAIEEVFNENDINPRSEEEREEAIEEYYDEIQERIYDFSAYDELIILEALREATSEFEIDIDADRVYQDLEIYDSEITATELEDKLRKSEALTEDIENSSHVIGQVFKSLGFDGIVLQSADKRFPSMDMGSKTSHIHVFEETPSQMKSTKNRGTFDPENPNIYKQENKATVTFQENQTIIRAFEKADVSSLVHELGHIFRRDLGGQDLAIAEEWAGVQDGNWTVPAEEKFARGFERYLAEGKAPNKELENVFKRFKAWLLEIYRTLKGSDIDIQITPEIQGVFDRLLTEQEEVGVQDGVDTLAQSAPKEKTKTTIRRTTGQAKDNTKTVSEREALRTSLKKAAQAARTAHSVGNMQGVMAERARMRDMIDRARDKRNRTKSANHIKGQIKRELKLAKVKKQSGKPVGKFGADIQAELDLLTEVSKLTPEEAEGRLITNLAQYENEIPPPEIALQNHMLEMVARLDSMTDPENLQALLDDIRALKDEGRSMQMMKATERKNKSQIAVNKTVEELGGLPEDLQTKGVRSFTPRSRSERARKFLHTIGKTIVGWDDILDMLSFKSSTQVGESFISKYNDLLGIKNREKRGTREVMQQVHDAYKDSFGLTSNRQVLKKIQEDNTTEMLIKDMPLVDVAGKPAPIDMKFTKAELRKRIMELQDPSLWPSFEYMGYTQETVAELTEYLDAQDKAFVKKQMEFYREYYYGTNDVYKEMYGVNLPQNDNYSPIMREGVSKPEDGGLGEFMREMSFRASAAKSGSLKSRVSSVKRISEQSDIAVLQRHIIEMEHFKAWAEKIRDLNAVWKDADVRTAVQIHHGRDMLALVDSFISDFALGGETLGHQVNALDQFRINFTKAALGVRPSIMIKQLTSFVAYAENMPVTSFAKYHAQFWTNPIKHSKEILESSELMKARGQNMERDIKAAMKSEEYSAFSKHQSFTNMLLLNVQMGDQGAILMGGWPYYQYLRDSKGYTHEQAIQAFEKFTERTQQSGDITEQSYWQRGGTLAKLFTMFMSSPNQYLRKEMDAVRNLVAGRRGAKQTTKILLIYHVVLPMFFQFVSDRFTWDEDEQKRAMILGALNGWFIIGDGLDYLLREALGLRPFSMEIPVYSFFHDVVKASALIDLFDLSSEEFFRAIRGLAGAVGAATGVPTKQAVELGNAGKDILQGKYEEGLTELMGYSPYKAEQLAED